MFFSIIVYLLEDIKYSSLCYRDRDPIVNLFYI